MLIIKQEALAYNLHEEKIELYERMLKEKDEMMIRLEKIFDK